MAEVRMGNRTYEVEVRGRTVIVDGQEFAITIRDDGEYLTVTAGGVPYRIQLPPEEERASGMTVHVDHRPFQYEYTGNLAGPGQPAPRAKPAAGQRRSRTPAKGAITAQIAGRVIKILVKKGDEVNAGDVLLLLEAMKMENQIKAPAAGTVREVPVKEGDRVAEGETLIVVG